MVADGFAADSRDYHRQAQQIRHLLFGQRDCVEPDGRRSAEGTSAVDWRAVRAGTHGEKDAKKPAPASRAP